MPLEAELRAVARDLRTRADWLDRLADAGAKRRTPRGGFTVPTEPPYDLLAEVDEQMGRLKRLGGGE